MNFSIKAPEGFQHYFQPSYKTAAAAKTARTRMFYYHAWGAQGFKEGDFTIVVLVSEGGAP